MRTQAKYTLAATLIQNADALIIAAGAGMGVDSGLPDFRGTQGFWQVYPALAGAGMDFESVANPNAFLQDPRLAWGFYGHRLGLYRSTLPHAGFTMLASWAAAAPLGHFVFTSNVDGQFQKAGFSESNLHECHGSIHFLQCMDSRCLDLQEPGSKHLGSQDAGVWSAERFWPDIDDAACRIRSAMPVCQQCGGLARPNILMFNDRNWQQSRAYAQEKAQQRWFNQMRTQRAKLVLIEIGAGTAIPTVRYFSQFISRKYGARIIRINLREPDVENMQDVSIASAALEALTGIDGALHMLRAHPNLKPQSVY